MKGRWLHWLVFVGLASAGMAYDPGADDVTAVSGRTSPDYIRKRQADGRYVPESYVFGKGGNWSGAMKDDSIDKVSLLDIGHIIAYPLAAKHYYPSKVPAKTELLIMVYWGTTHAPGEAGASAAMQGLQQALGDVSIAGGEAKGFTATANAGNASQAAKTGALIKAVAESEFDSALALVQAQNRLRRDVDLVNIRMLGYDSWYDETNKDARGTALEEKRNDLWQEIEHNRYFVVLMAYDFQLLTKEKKRKLLWETRFSIRQDHHLFDKDLASMALYASRYFGQDSGGLVRDRVPLGRVDIGDLRNLGDAPPPK